MRKMDFLNYVQRPYTNVTVRNGMKWANLAIDEHVMLTDNGKDVEEARICQIVVKRFKNIKHEEIKREHDTSCTTKGKLYQAMKRAYPDFRESDVVTIVTYVRGGK